MSYTETLRAILAKATPPISSMHQAIIDIDANKSAGRFSFEYLNGCDFTDWEREIIVTALVPIYTGWVNQTAAALLDEIDVLREENARLREALQIARAALRDAAA